MPYTKLRYHLVFATKYRAPLIAPEVEDFLYPVLGKAAKNAEGRTLCIGGIEDQVHLICAIPPHIAVGEFTRTLKSQSTAALRGKFPSLRNFSWQVGYGGFTLKPGGLSKILAYVKNQRRHHQHGNLLEKYEKTADLSPALKT